MTCFIHNTDVVVCVLGVEVMRIPLTVWDRLAASVEADRVFCQTKEGNKNEKV